MGSKMGRPQFIHFSGSKPQSVVRLPNPLDSGCGAGQGSAHRPTPEPGNLGWLRETSLIFPWIFAPSPKRWVAPAWRRLRCPRWGCRQPRRSAPASPLRCRARSLQRCHWQLSTRQPLARSSSPQWDGEENGRKAKLMG